VRTNRARLITIWDRAGLAGVVLGSWVLFGVFADGFLSQFNIYSVGRLVSILVVVGLSQMVVLAIGDFNLSVGAMGGVVAMFLGWLIEQWGIPWQLAIPLSVCFGAVLGTINGLLIIKSRLTGFIVTLGTAGVFSGTMFILTKVEAFRDLPQSFLDFGKTKFFNLVSPLVIVMLVLVFALYTMYKGSTLGRQTLATGANRRAAQISGISTDRIVVIAHALSGALAGVAGVMLVLRIGSAIPSIGTAGGGDWLLPSFAVAAIGGTLLTGGVVNVPGALFGGLLLGTIENGLTLLNIPSFWVQLISGLVLLVAVVLDRVRAVTVERSRMGVAA
jgi:ribose transport system permease protein